VARQCDNLAGIKDSSGSVELLAGYQAAAPEGRDFAVFVGPEILTLPALKRGGAGVISGSSNIVPRLFVELYRAFREGDLATAERLQSLVDQLSPCLRLHTFPSVVKEAAGIGGPCRKPVGPVPPEVRERLSKALAVIEAAGYKTLAASRATA
jgi:4-hydroxy-tetrahydrodipicolinate synthase